MTTSTKSRIWPAITRTVAGVVVTLIIVVNTGLYLWPVGIDVYAKASNKQERSQLAITATVAALPTFELQAVSGTPVPVPREIPILMSDVNPEAQPTVPPHIEEPVQSQPHSGGLTRLSVPTAQYLKDIIPDNISAETLQQAGLANLLQSGSNSTIPVDPVDEPVPDDFAGDEAFEKVTTPSQAMATQPSLTLLPDENEIAAPGDLSLSDSGNEEISPTPPAPSVPAVTRVDLSTFSEQIPELEEPMADENAIVADPQPEIETVLPAFQSATLPEVSTSAEPNDPRSTPFVPQPEPPLISPEPAPSGKSFFAACGQKTSRFAVIDICSMVFIAQRYGSDDVAADVTADGIVNDADLTVLAQFYRQPVLFVRP